MRPNYLLASFAAFALFHSTANALDECMATLKDPHGSVIVREYGKVAARLKGGEHFLAEPGPYGWSVYLKSGCNGFIGKAKLQLLPNEPVMKLNYDQEKKLWQKLQSARDSERYDAISAKEHGVNYFQLLTAAGNGDLKAIARFDSLGEFMDGVAGESYVNGWWRLFHVAGDEIFANYLKNSPEKTRESYRDTFSIVGLDAWDPISKPKPYLKQNFPKTYEILFGKGQ